MASAAVTERCKKNKNLLEWLDSIILAVAVLSLVFTFAARAIRVDGHSMDPTLHDQQLLIINSLPYQPSHGDIVVIDAYTPHGQTLIKRVIGVAGSTLILPPAPCTATAKHWTNPIPRNRPTPAWI